MRQARVNARVIHSFIQYYNFVKNGGMNIYSGEKGTLPARTTMSGEKMIKRHPHATDKPHHSSYFSAGV